MPRITTTFNEDDERFKLRRVRAQIEALCIDNDICADVVLAGRGRIEVFMRLDASWSVLRMVDGGLHLRSQRADYGDDVERQHQELAWTVGMVHALAEVKGNEALGWLKASGTFDKGTGATHTPLRPDPDA